MACFLHKLFCIRLKRSRREALCGLHSHTSQLERILMKISTRLLTSGALLVSASAAPAFSFDGKFDASDYERVFSVSYDHAGQTIGGGVLALATVGSDQYL